MFLWKSIHQCLNHYFKYLKLNYFKIYSIQDNYLNTVILLNKSKLHNWSIGAVSFRSNQFHI